MFNNNLKDQFILTIPEVFVGLVGLAGTVIAVAMCW